MLSRSSPRKTPYTVRPNTSNKNNKPTIVFVQGSLPISLILKDNNDLWINFEFNVVINVFIIPLYKNLEKTLDF